MLSNIHEQEPVCGWQDGSEEEKCEVAGITGSTEGIMSSTEGIMSSTDGRSTDGVTDSNKAVSITPTWLLTLFALVLTILI